MKMLLLSLVLGLASSVSFAGVEEDTAQLGKTLIANSAQDVRELPYTLKSLQLNAVERSSDGKILAISFKTNDYNKFDCAYDRANEEQVCSVFVCEAVVSVRWVSTYATTVSESDVKSCKFDKYIRN